MPVTLPTGLWNADRMAVFDADRDQDLDLLRSAPAALHANRLTQNAAPWLALAGQPFELQFSCRPGAGIAGCVAIPALGFAYAPTPIAVPPFGWFLLAPTNLLHPQPWVAIDPVTGAGSHRMAIPSDPVFLDLEFFVQALVVDPTGSATHLTNAAASVVQR